MIFEVFFLSQFFLIASESNFTQIEEASTFVPLKAENMTNLNQDMQNYTFLSNKPLFSLAKNNKTLTEDSHSENNKMEDEVNSTDSRFSVFVTLIPGDQLSLEHLNLSCTACNVSANQNATLDFQWFINGKTIKSKDPKSYTVNKNFSGNCLKAMVSFIELTNSDSGNVVCMVTDEEHNLTNIGSYFLNLPAPPLVSLQEFPLPLIVNQTLNITCISYIPTRMPEGYLAAATVTITGQIVLEEENMMENSISFQVSEKLRLNAGQEFKKVTKEISLPFNAHSLEVRCSGGNEFGRFNSGKFTAPVHKQPVFPIIMT